VYGSTLPASISLGTARAEETSRAVERSFVRLVFHHEDVAR
jgi:hypothetical protein